MEKKLYELLQKLIGIHRQLLDVVRLEREALVEAHLKDIQNITGIKQGLVEEVHRVESERLKIMGALAVAWSMSSKELTLQKVIIRIQGNDLKLADQFRAAFNALNILIQRISDQNNHNKKFLERSIEHVDQMKKNVLEESQSQANTYTQQGQRSTSAGTSRLISKEA